MEIVKITKVLKSKYKGEYPQSRPFIIGIDGLGGSGKTSLALQLKNELISSDYEILILHIDDYIVEKEKRYETGFEEWYEYYYLQWDVELIKIALFNNLKKNIRQLTLPFYDKSMNTILKQIMDVPPNGIIIIEGVFLQRQEWRSFFDYMIFLDCNHELRSKRVLRRDQYLGDYNARIEKYKRRYWLAEDFYLQNENPIGYADYIYRVIE